MSSTGYVNIKCYFILSQTLTILTYFYMYFAIFSQKNLYCAVLHCKFIGAKLQFAWICISANAKLYVHVDTKNSKL